MSELTYKDDGTPFATVEAAKAKITRLGQDGLDLNVVEVEGGFALERKPRITGKRKPIGTSSRLTVDSRDKDPNFHYRIVNDDPPGRIKMFEEAGYEVVKENVSIGDRQAGDGKQIGKIAEKQVGGGVKAYLMKIPKKWYNEDQEAKARRLREAESAMRDESNKQGRYGKVEVGRKTTPY